VTDIDPDNGRGEQATQNAKIGMARRGPRVEFLDRVGYRQRRIRDAARVLPVVAVALMILPLMWSRDEPKESLTSSGIIYLFGLWIVLVVLAFILSKVLRFADVEMDNEATNRGADE